MDFNGSENLNQPTIGGSSCQQQSDKLLDGWRYLPNIFEVRLSNMNILVACLKPNGAVVLIWEQHSNSCNAPGTGITLRPPMTNLRCIQGEWSRNTVLVWWWVYWADMKYFMLTYAHIILCRTASTGPNVSWIWSLFVLAWMYKWPTTGNLTYI